MNTHRPPPFRPCHPISDPSSISPLRLVDACVEIHAGLADVTLRFHWHHPGPSALHLSYPFPLPPHAVVYHSEYRLPHRRFPTRRLTAPAARALRFSPQSRGRTCVQLRRVHPAWAHFSIDFLPPHCPLETSVSFLLPVEYRGTLAEFVLPLCPPVLPGLPMPQLSTPYPPPPPRLPASHPQAPHWTFHGRLLDPTRACQPLESPSHPLLVHVHHQEQSFALAQQPAFPHADLVLRWQDTHLVPGHARVWSDGNAPVAHALLHIAAPRPSPSPLTSPPHPQPVHLLIDASGSMRGRKWTQACRTTRARLAQLPKTTPVSVAVFHASLTWILHPTRPAHEAAADHAWYDHLEATQPQGLGSPETALSSWISSLLSSPPHLPAHLEWLTDGEFLPPQTALAQLLQNTPFSLHCLLLGGHPGNPWSHSWPNHPRLHRQILSSFDPPESWVLHHPALLPEPVLTHLQLSRPWLPLTPLPSALRTGEVHSILVTGPTHLTSLQLHGRTLLGSMQSIPLTVSTDIVPAIALLAQAQAIPHHTPTPLTHPPTHSEEPDPDPVPLFPSLVDIGIHPGPALPETTCSLEQPALEPQTLTDPSSPYPPLPPLDPLRESPHLPLPSLPPPRTPTPPRPSYRPSSRTPRFLPLPSDSKMAAP